jgi:hypothetical protein
VHILLPNRQWCAGRPLPGNARLVRSFRLFEWNFSATLADSGALPRVPAARHELRGNLCENALIRFHAAATLAAVFDFRVPALQEKLAKLGVEPMTMTTEQFAAYVKSEIAANAVLVKAAGIKVQ